MIPGEVIFGSDDAIRFNDQPPNLDLPDGVQWRRTVYVKNFGDRAIQVGSHFHFYEANPGFDITAPGTLSIQEHREQEPNGLEVLSDIDADVPVSEAEKRRLTSGYRLDIPAGTALRFEPGCKYTVPLVALAGEGTVEGLSTRGILKKWKWEPAEIRNPRAGEAGQPDPVPQDDVRGPGSAEGGS